MTELRLIGEHDVDRVFDDSCIDKLLAIGKIELSCRKRANFINDLRTAVRHYIRDAGDQRSPLQEIKELESSASRMDFEEVAGALEALSAPARTHFAERTRRPGWTAIGATLPSADELRDPARQVAACEMVRRLCRQGGGAISWPVIDGGPPSLPRGRESRIRNAVRKHGLLLY